MPPRSESPDPWSLPDMQDAAVDYVVAECGQPPAALKTPRGKEWVIGAAHRCSPVLGIDTQRLTEIILARHVAPLHIRLPIAPTTSTPACPEKDDKAEDALARLLNTEAESLAADEREELLDLLDTGAPLSRDQRTAIALLLRGSSTATRADLVRALLNWLCPKLTIPAYAVQQCRVTLYEPCGIRIVPARRWLETRHRRLNRQHVLVVDSGGYSRLFCYAAAAAVRRSRTRVSTLPFREWDIRFLHPQGNALDDVSLRKNLTLLAAFVHQDRTPGKDWANTFGETPAMTSWRKTRLNKKLNESTGDRTFVFPGLRAKPDPRKGKTRLPKSA